MERSFLDACQSGQREKKLKQYGETGLAVGRQLAKRSGKGRFLGFVLSHRQGKGKRKFPNQQGFPFLVPKDCGLSQNPQRTRSKASVLSTSSRNPVFLPYGKNACVLGITSRFHPTCHVGLTLAGHMLLAGYGSAFSRSNKCRESTMTGWNHSAQEIKPGGTILTAVFRQGITRSAKS